MYKTQGTCDGLTSIEVHTAGQLAKAYFDLTSGWHSNGMVPKRRRW